LLARVDQKCSVKKDVPKEGCEQSSTSRGAMKGMPIEGHNLIVKEGQVSLVKIMEEST